MKQYFIGVNMCNAAVIDNLFDFGASLMFRHHWQVIELNEQYEFWDGEWMIYCDDECRINDVKTMLDGAVKIFDSFKYEIVSIN